MPHAPEEPDTEGTCGKQPAPFFAGATRLFILATSLLEDNFR
jgi:hypothetical protein